MAVVLAGPYNSRSYVIGSFVLHEAQKRFPSFFYRLIPMKMEWWKNWLRRTCKEEKWPRKDLKKVKVLSWVEKCYTGSKKTLVGGLPAFLEFMNDKYGVSRNLTVKEVEELITLSEEHWRLELEKEAENKGHGGSISIVGAGSNEAVNFLLYALMTVKTPMLRFGFKVKLFEAHEEREKKLQKNFDKMSLVESNINICIVDDLDEVFRNCDLIIFLGDKFRTQGMDIEKFLYEEKVLYGTYGLLCNFLMEEQTNVMFACMENATFNAQCFLSEAPKIDRKKVVACTSYLGTELKMYISRMAGFPIESIDQIPIWGMADTCHLVDVDKGGLIFRIPDRRNPKFLDIKSLSRLIKDDFLRGELYKFWKLKEKTRVVEWKLSKVKKKLQYEEDVAKERNERLAMLRSMADEFKEMEKKYGRRQYWERWQILMKEAIGDDKYYSPKNMFRRFKKGLYRVLQDKRYYKNEKKQEIKKEEDYIELCKKLEALRAFDPMNTSVKGLNDIKELFDEIVMDVEEEEEEDEKLFENVEMPEDVKEIETLKRELYTRQKTLNKKIRSYWRKHMEEEIRRLEEELRRKSFAQGSIHEEVSNIEELMEEEVLSHSNIGSDKSEKESDINIKMKLDMDIEQAEEMFDNAEEMFNEGIPEIPLTEREELNEIIKDYFRLKMKLERKVKELEIESEITESSDSEDFENYEMRELGYISKTLNNLWRFVGVCKHAVRRRIGQDPYIAQVTEAVKVLKIWFLDPYMKNQIIFLGINSDYDVYPFLTDTVMSQPAFCDEDMRWHPFKEANNLWPMTEDEKTVDDNPEKPVPFFRTPKEGQPFTIKYVIGTSLECLMHFKIPPASYFEAQRELRDHADQKEYFELMISKAKADKSQLKDLLRRLGEDIDSSIEEDLKDNTAEEGEEEGIEEVEVEVEAEAKVEAEGEFEEEFEMAGEELDDEMQMDQVESEQFSSKRNVPSLDKAQPLSPKKSKEKFENKVEELDKLGEDEFELGLDGEEFLSEYESAEEKSFHDYVDEDEDEENILSFLKPYGDDLTIEEFLKLFEKQKKLEDYEDTEEKKKPVVKKKNIWEDYLEGIGFYKLNIPETVIVKDEKEADISKNKENPEDISEDTSTQSSDVHNEGCFEEESEEISGELLAKESKKGRIDLNRGIGYIENLEQEFCDRDFAEMPNYYKMKKKSGRVIYSEKGIFEEHVKKVGFPIDTKGKSEFSLHGELNRMDYGKGEFRRPSDIFSFNEEEKEIHDEKRKANGEYLDLWAYKKKLYIIVNTGLEEEKLKASTEFLDNQDVKKKLKESTKEEKDQGKVRFSTVKKPISVIRVSTFPESAIKRSVASIASKFSTSPENALRRRFASSVSFPQSDDSSDSQEAYIPDIYLHEEEEEESSENYLFEKFEEIDVQQGRKSETDRSLLRICVRPMSAVELCIVDRSAKLGVIERKENSKPGEDWVHDLVEEFSNPEKIPELERTLETDYHNLPAHTEKEDIKHFEEKISSRKESEEEYNLNQEDLEKQEVYEKVKRIMELEKISGNKYLHLEPEENKISINKELARRTERFTIWINSVIDEHNKIRQSLDQSYLPLEFIEQMKSTGVIKSEIPEVGEKYEQIKEHHEWINGMIKEIIMIDQVHDLEKVIKSVKGSMPQEEGLLSESDETLGTVLAEATRGNMLAKMDGITNLTIEQGDVDDDVVNSSDEDNKEEEEEWLYALPPESEAVLQEITKTEKELTKDCHDLKSYVQKCRDNTKLFSLYRGDTPKEWKFLGRRPGESRTTFKYRALLHAMETMSELQEGFISDMIEQQKQDIDLADFMSEGDLIEPVPYDFKREEYVFSDEKFVVPEENEFYDSMEEEGSDTI